MNIEKRLSFGFEQTFTIPNWWADEGFCNTSSSPLKLEKMDDLSNELAAQISGHVLQSFDIWENKQFEIYNELNEIAYYVTMDPGCIEVKTSPKLISQIEKHLQPLFNAASSVELVPYRNWWYGIQTGTEGGCHINMGGLTKDSNIFVERPFIAAQYAAYMHNRPFLSYPFMGVDVGPGGNAERLDEAKNYLLTESLFSGIHQEEIKNIESLHEYFKGSDLINNKSGFPSLRKLHQFLRIEDRAQESFRCAEDARLVCELRVKIFEKLQGQSQCEELISFNPDELHGIQLTSFHLWEKFQFWCNDLNINPVPYQRFFERQFPSLQNSQNAPQKFIIREGRKPRKTLEVFKNKQGEITGKKVDTSQKRLELIYHTLSEDQLEFNVTGDQVSNLSVVTRHNGYLNFGQKGISYYQYLDLKSCDQLGKIQVVLKDKLTGQTIESVSFSPKDMTFCNDI